MSMNDGPLHQHHFAMPNDSDVLKPRGTRVVIETAQRASFRPGSVFVLVLIVVLFASVLPASGQHGVYCDTSCGGAPVDSRASIVNARGSGSIISPATSVGKTTIIEGSQSFSYKVPLFAIPGRNGLNLDLTLYYNSAVWNGSSIGYALNSDLDNPSPGFRLDFGFIDAFMQLLVDPDGTTHLLSNGSSPFQLITMDGTFTQIAVSNTVGSSPLIATFKNGLQVTYTVNGVYRPTQIEDTNGNYLTISYLNNNASDTTVNHRSISSVTDTTGRTINFFYDSTGTMLQCVTTASNCNTPNTATYAFVWNHGTSNAYTLNFNFNSVNVSMVNNDVFGDGPIIKSGQVSYNILTSVIRPDGTSVTFDYGDWGEVNKIQELGNTGQVRYSASYNYPLASAGTLTHPPTFTQETIFDGVNTGTWNYQSTVGSTSNVSRMVTQFQVTDPCGTTTTANFSAAGNVVDGLPTTTQITSAPPASPAANCPNVPTQTWRTTAKGWTTDNVGNPRLTSRTVTLDDNSQSQTAFKSYDANGNPTDVLEYDIGPPINGTPTPGPLIKETKISYASLGNHILDRANDVQVYDGKGNFISHTTFNYDEVSTQGRSPLPPMHDETNYGPSSATARGNMTSSVVYTNAAAGTDPINSSFTYDEFGNLIVSSTGCCTQQQRTFSNLTAYAYPDSNAVGPTGSQLTTSYSYNFGTGANFGFGTVASITDPNGQITSLSYDIDNRLTSTKTPDGVTVQTAFDDSSANPVITGTNTANSLVAKTTLDGKGRTLSSQISNGSSNVSTTTMAYNILGELQQASNPLGPNDSAVYTTYSYDALGRVTQTTPPVLSGSSSQNPYQASYSGATATMTDPAGKQRKQYKDALGRLVRVDEPGLINAQSATSSVTISGAEQSVPTSSGNGATAGTATVTIGSSGPSGYFFCSMENQTCMPGNGTTSVAYGSNGTYVFQSASPGTGIGCNNTTFGDPTPNIVKACYMNSSTGTYDRSEPVLTHAATQATVTVTIGGANTKNTSTATTCTRSGCTSHTFQVPDSGNISLTVNASGTILSTGNVPYGASSSQATLASGLYSQFPANSLVSISNPNGGNSFTITALSAGSSANSFSISTSVVSSCEDSDTVSCAGPGWTMNLSGPNLGSTTASPENFTGGTDNIFTTTPDTGSVVVNMTVNGTVYTKQSNYNASSSPSSIVTDLFQQITADPVLNQLIIAGVISGTTLQLTTTATGAGTNYPFSVSSVTNSPNYQSGSTSFTATPSGSTFSSGQNGTLYDSGAIKATLTGFSETPVTESVTFGQGSTPASIAISVAAAFHNDAFSPVDAAASLGSPIITFTARTPGTDANSYSITVAEQSNSPSNFPTPSFATISTQLSGGATGTASFDPSVVFSTTYTYDPLGDLLQVNQGQQTRSYQYDSLGRVTSSTIPETGYQASSASYTDFGGLSQSIDPRVAPGTSNHLTTSIGYDSLNRPHTITYSDGTPGVTYTYNPPGSANNTGGRLVTVTNGIASETYQYDVMGRVSQCQKTIAGQTYTTSYSYNPDGTPLSMTYPSGRTVNFGEDAIGRLSQIGTNGNNLLTVNSYNAAGEVLTETYGNGIAGTYAFNNQLQLGSLQYAGASSILSLTYNYGGAADNGQIQGITDNLVSSRSTSYSYDELGRLSRAQTNDQTSANTWALKYNYDRYGNRLSEIPVGGTGTMPMNEVVVDPNTNHITSGGVAYDSAGNMISDGLFGYSYNILNQMTSVMPVGGGTAAATFNYDSNGLRVIKNSTVYIYSGRKVIAEYASGAVPASPTTEYIYRGELRLATITGGAISYQYPDHLSVRAETDPSGNVMRTFGHYPFGGIWYENGTGDKWKFTSYESDSESGLNYAGARFQSPRVGRFTALDSAPADPLNPQSWNRYGYTANDPINLWDPTGLIAQRVCMLNDTGDETNVCVSFGSFLDSPTMTSGASWGDASLNYVPGYGFMFASNGLSLQIGLNNPCSMSPISDGCGFQLQKSDISLSPLALNPALDPSTCLPRGEYGPRAPGLGAQCELLPPDNCTLELELPCNMPLHVNFPDNVKPPKPSSKEEMLGCILAPNGAALEIAEIRETMQTKPEDTEHPDGPGAVWMPNSNTSKNGGQATVGSPQGAATANALAIGSQTAANTFYCVAN